MTTRGPFVVRLCTPDDSLAVDAEDLSFSSTWRGGFADATVRLKDPLNRRSAMLAPFAKLRIDDTRSCKVAWEGYVDLPGKSRGDDGDVWQIGGVGPAARLSDRQKPYIAVDTDIGSWKFQFASNKNMTAGRDVLPTDEETECLLLSFPDGVVLGNGYRVTLTYDRLLETGQLLGGIGFTHQEGFTAAGDWRVQILARTDSSGTSDTTLNRLYNTVPQANATRSAGDAIGWTVGRDELRLRINRDSGGATTVNTNDNWSGFTAFRVSALRRQQNGAYLSGTDTYPEDFTVPSMVIPDVLYWFTTDAGSSLSAPPVGGWGGSIDIVGAALTSQLTGYNIDQLAYAEPTTAQQVLEDLALFYPYMAWRVSEANDAGRHRFAAWSVSNGSTYSGFTIPGQPLSPDQSGARYQATAEDGWDAPGGEADLRNAITVHWTNGKGEAKSKSYLAEDFDISVPELDQWAIRRDADAVDLGSELGSVSNADRIAEQILTQAARPPQAGTLTVAHKIHDLWEGRDVDPWEIQPGYPLLISDIDIDPLPVTEVSYNDSDGSAAVTLSEPVLTTDQLVNRLQRRRQRTA